MSAMENIDYDALKKRGFLRQKQEGFFVLRTRVPHGVYYNAHLTKFTQIAERYGRGFVHITTRQGIEVPYIRFEDIGAVENEFLSAGIECGTSGPRMRTTTCCPGNNWCKSGLVDTFSLYDRIEKELGIRCGLELPHKFKIAIAGCPNTCTRPQQSEIGIHGQAGGYAVYLAGCGGRTPRIGFRLNKIFSEDEVLHIVSSVVRFFKENAKPRQRLALLVEEKGRESLLKYIWPDQGVPEIIN